ncbi:MAG: hypothetical protein AAGI90_02180 [Chlamydiota bacterium]
MSPKPMLYTNYYRRLQEFIHADSNSWIGTEQRTIRTSNGKSYVVFVPTKRQKPCILVQWIIRIAYRIYALFYGTYHERLAKSLRKVLVDFARVNPIGTNRPLMQKMTAKVKNIFNKIKKNYPRKIQTSIEKVERSLPKLTKISAAVKELNQDFEKLSIERGLGPRGYEIVYNFESLKDDRPDLFENVNLNKIASCSDPSSMSTEGRFLGAIPANISLPDDYDSNSDIFFALRDYIKNLIETVRNNSYLPMLSVSVNEPIQVRTREMLRVIFNLLYLKVQDSHKDVANSVLLTVMQIKEAFNHCSNRISLHLERLLVDLLNNQSGELDLQVILCLQKYRDQCFRTAIHHAIQNSGRTSLSSIHMANAAFGIRQQYYAQVGLPPAFAKDNTFQGFAALNRHYAQSIPDYFATEYNENNIIEHVLNVINDPNNSDIDTQNYSNEVLRRCKEQDDNLDNHFIVDSKEGGSYVKQSIERYLRDIGVLRAK